MRQAMQGVAAAIGSQRASAPWVQQKQKIRQKTRSAPIKTAANYLIMCRCRERWVVFGGSGGQTQSQSPLSGWWWVGRRRGRAQAWPGAVA